MANQFSLKEGFYSGPSMSEQTTGLLLMFLSFTYVLSRRVNCIVLFVALIFKVVLIRTVVFC